MRILNFGSCNIDLVYTLDHIALSGETEATIQLSSYPGGKGLNQSVAAAKAGAEIYHAGLTGSDGKELVDIMEQNGVNVSYMRTVEGKSGHAIIQVTRSGENSIFTYPGANREFTEAYVDEVLSDFGQNDILLLQNETNLLDYIVERASQKGMLIVLNPSPVNEELKKIDFDKLTYLILNEVEAKDLTGTSDAEASIMYLQRRSPKLKIMLTLGKRGCVYADGSERMYHPAFKVEAVDTTAAGTVFAGYFIARIAGGSDVYSSVRWASAAAALAVSRYGAAPSVPTSEEVAEALNALKPERLDNDASDKVNQITGYIESHISDAALSELAAQLGYTSVYASSIIKKLTGKTFSEILQEKRCEVAAKLLKETDMAIDEIIYSVGYENESFFRKKFKARYGECPLKYRNNRK